MKKCYTILLAFLAVFVLAACGQSSSSKTAQKDSGSAVSKMPKIEGVTYYGQVPQSPKRIVSLTSTYTGYLLKLKKNLVGVSSYDKKNPVLKDRVADAEQVTADDLEKIQQLKPDLIVAGSTEKNIDQLAEIAPVITVEYGKRDYLQIHSDFGQIFNQEKEAQNWVKDWKDKTKQAAEELKAATGKDVTFTVMGLFEKEIYLFGDNWGRGGEVIYQALGYQAPQKVVDDVFKDGYLSISQESLPDYAGDYLIVAAEDDKTGQSLYESDIWKNLPAVQKDQVIRVDANAFYFNDPLTLEYELKTLKAAILEKAK